MRSLFSVLINTIRSKFSAVFTRIRYLTNISYLRTVVLGRIRKWLTGIFNVKPRHKKDYYTVLRWLVSRRLIHAAVIVAGIVSICYLVWFSPACGLSKMGSGGMVYAYSSIPLRFVEGKVKIKAKSGYIAYVGDVSKGAATGNGELYGPDGALVYSGAFEQNKYNGGGTLYYPMGQAQYKGEFRDNLFEGMGVRYRESGTKLYSGMFSGGFEEGEGTLYDGSETVIYTGGFHRGEIVYTQLLDKAADEIAKMYTGKKTLYRYGSQYVAALEDIGAFYAAGADTESVSDSMRSDCVYVAKDSFVYGSEEIRDIGTLKKALGEPSYEGNGYITFPEAVVTSWLKDKGEVQGIDAGLDVTRVYKELADVNAYAQDTLVYLYVFRINDLSYTFIAPGRDLDFFMYAIEE